MNPMTELKKLYRKSLLLLTMAPLVSLAASWAWAQAPAQSSTGGTATAPAPLGSAPRRAPGSQDQKSDPSATPEQKISPKEAEELFHDVDQILQFASKDSGLPIRKEVKRRLTSRDEVVEYLEKTMNEDKDAQRLRRSELVL